MMKTYSFALGLWLVARVSADIASTNQQEAGHLQQSVASPLYESWSLPSREQTPSEVGVGTQGLNVQTGYEGYLVGLPSSSSILPTGLLDSLYPSFAVRLFSRVGIWLASFILLTLVGGSLTAAICAFTPFCTISFLGLGISRENMRSYLTPDRITAVTHFIDQAVEKYKELQNKPTKNK